MRKLLFIVAFLFVGVSFADSDSLGVNSSKDNPNYKIVNGIGKESKIDSVVRTEEEVLIYIDGVKTPVIQKDTKIYPVPVPVPTPNPNDTISSDTSSVSGSTKAVATKNSSVGGLGFLPFLLGLLGIGFLAAGIITGKKKEDGNNASEAVASENTLNPTGPTTAPVPDNRFVPVVDPDHAPAYPNMPSREELNPVALPNMLRSAYSRQNISNELGIITQVLETKFGRLNGRFTMEHADGTRSVQEFQNEPGVKARVRFSNGIEATVYSRYSCLNNLRALQVAEISQQPTFVEEPRVEVTNNTTTTTEFQPEPVPSEIVEVPTPEAAPAVETPAVPVPVTEVTTAPPAVPDEPAPMPTLADDDPITTVTINGKEISAPLSVVKELLK